MAGRVIDVEADSAPARALYEGEVLALRRHALSEGRTLRLESAPGEERVLVALSGRGRYRGGAMADDGPGQVFAPGRVGVVRSGEWCEMVGEGPDPLVVVEVGGPEPPRRP